jgi:hypothetical protein
MDGSNYSISHEAALIKRNVLGKLEEVCGGRLEVFGKRPWAQHTQNPPKVDALLLATNAAVVAFAATEKQVRHNPIARTETRDPVPDRRNYPGRLVAQDVRQGWNVAKPVHNVQVCTAYAAAPSLNQDFIGTDFGQGDIFYF